MQSEKPSTPASVEPSGGNAVPGKNPLAKDPGEAPMQSPPAAEEIRAEITDVRAQTEARLSRLLAGDPSGQDLVQLGMRESVLAPGKRLRPLLTVLAARDLGADTPAALDAGCAIELLHTASLILDDLPCMEEAALPRGSGSIHIKQGEDVAVLASVGLVAQAFGLAAVAPLASAEQRVQLVSVLAQAAGVHGLVGGRYADLRASRAPTSADVAVSSDRKSSSLFQAAVDCASIIAAADPDSRAALRTFAKELGRAFHILDDLLDAETAGGEAPTTLVSMVGPQAAHRRLAFHAEKAVAALGDLPVYPTRLSGLVQSVFAEAVEARRQRNSAADLQVSGDSPDPAANPQFG